MQKLTMNRKISYSDTVAKVAGLDFIPWSMLCGKSILVTGATGMIGTHLLNVLCEKNRQGADIRLVVAGRCANNVWERFGHGIAFIHWDMNEPPPLFKDHVDYIIHLASNTHPLAYVDDAVGTVMMNVVAAKHLLDWSVMTNARFVYASSVEVYGQNRDDVDRFDEAYCGYIDCNTLRAGYPESKRCGESLCQAYRKKFGVDFVTPRIARCYGPTLRCNDTKALSQFIRKALLGENVVLKSEGLQQFSYIHVSDAVTGILTTMLAGRGGEAYNVADKASDIMLKDLATLVAGAVGRKVVFELPNEHERSGFSVATKALMDGSKLNRLGWRAIYSIKEGVCDTMAILRQEGWL